MFERTAKVAYFIVRAFQLVGFMEWCSRNPYKLGVELGFCFTFMDKTGSLSASFQVDGPNQISSIREARKRLVKTSDSYAHSMVRENFFAQKLPTNHCHLFTTIFCRHKITVSRFAVQNPSNACSLANKKK